MDLVLLLFVSTAFFAVAGAVYAAGLYLHGRDQLRRRLPAGGVTADANVPQSASMIGSLVTEHFTEDRYGVDSTLRRKLRRELLRAGYFSPLAIRYYLFARFSTVVILPCATFAVIKVFIPHLSLMMLTLAVSIAAGVGVLGPDAFLSRRQSKLAAEYRLIFPDLLDLLTVCVSAGLSVEASFDRIRDQLGRRSSALGRNIELMGAEMRAGRSSIESLSALADRLALDEAASFVAVLRHSVELGGDVAASLRVFSEDMRAKRMLLAEKKANELPVKMVLPLALGIFPVILTIVLLPVALKLLKVIGQTALH
jgi:tight adherence protein C